MKIFREFFVLLVSFFFVEGDFRCKPLQYFEIGSSGTLDCSSPRVFQAVYWYDSPDTNANIIVGMEIKDSGSFSRIGPGFLNGSYDISDEGHLIIRNITPVHERTLQAVLVDDSDVIPNYTVTVVTTYNLGGNYPAIDACHIAHTGTNNCVVSFIGSLVKCTYNYSRPAVSLSWQVEYPTQKKHSVEGSDNVYLDSKFTYTSTSTLEISEIAHNPLLVLTCSAFGPAITTDNVNSSVVVDGTNSSYFDWPNFAKYDQYIYINSREELHCNNSLRKSSAYMWKYETHEASKVLMYFMNGQEWQSNTLSGVSFTKEGSLVFEKITVAQAGTYTCVTIDNELSALVAFNVNVIVPPSPPGIDVAGCPTVNNDCELYLRDNTSTLVSCNVTGVKPKVSLSIQSLTTSGVTILTRESIENNQGDLFNAAIVAEVQLHGNATSPFIVACVASGPGSQSFNPRRIVSLVPDTCQYSAVSRSVYTISISTAGVLTLLIVMTICFIVNRKMVKLCFKRGWGVVYNSDSPVRSNKPVPLNPKDLPDAIMDWPLRNVDSYDIFDQEAIRLLHNVSDEIERNRKRKNLGVVGGSAAGIIAGGLSIAGAVLIPFTFGASVGFMVAGGIVGVAGAGLSIGFSLEKLLKDKQRVKIVQPALDNFIVIQKELATTVALVSVMYDIVKDDRFRKSFDEANKDELRSLLRDIVSSYDQYHKNINEKLATIYRFTERITKHFIHNPNDENQKDETKLAIELTSLIGEDWHRSWQEKLTQAKSTPFEVLDNAINQLRQATKDRSAKLTFLTLVNILYVDGFEDAPAEKSQKDNNHQSLVVIKPAAAAAGAAARVAAGFGDDAAKIGANVTKVARGVTVAGIVLSAVGIVVDIVFLGHAAYDLLDTKREQFSQALTDVAHIMATMNKLTSIFAKLDNIDPETFGT